ncbi:MAG: hypothetical protein ACTTH8_05550 [Treponema sp.]
MSKFFRYTILSFLPFLVIGCAAAPQVQETSSQEPEVREVPVVELPKPVVVQETITPQPVEISPQVLEPEPPAVQSEPEKPAIQKDLDKPEPAEIVPEPAAAPELVKEEPQQPEQEQQVAAEVQKEPEPVKEEPKQPEPVMPKDEIIAEFEGVTITRETYDQTKSELEKVVEQLNKITATRDYNKWLDFLSPQYKRDYSDPAVLKVVSEALPVKGIKLKTLKDFFTYVFVPSRSKIRVDDIVFLSPQRVNVLMRQEGKTVLIYGIENTNGEWKLLSPKY